MNPFAFAFRRPITTFFLVVGLAAAGVYALKQRGIDVLEHVDPAYVELVKSKGLLVMEKIGLGAQHEEESEHKEEGEQAEQHKVVVSSPKQQDVVLTQDYVCQIHSQRHINVCALENGYIEEIAVKEGQAVKKGQVLFRVLPVLYKAKLDAELAEARLAQLEYNNTKRLSEGNLPVVSVNEVALLEAKLAKAQAKAQLAAAEYDFTYVRAPFDGIVDTQHHQLGSLIKEGDVLTTLSDNSLMWVYFNVPEKRYLEYMSNRDHDGDDQIELVLADGNKFQHKGKIGAIEAKFNNETGNIPFRADFPNPNGLLRHGQTGTVQIRHVAKNALVIPQRATFPILDKLFVFVIGKDDVAHQREVVVENEMDDIYMVKGGIGVNDRIVLEGRREVHDGEKVVYEFRRPDVVIAQLKYRAE